MILTYPVYVTPLSHCGLVAAYHHRTLLTLIGSVNALLPDDTKPLPECWLIIRGFVTFIMFVRAILQEMLNISTFDMSLKINNLIFQLHLPGAKELGKNVIYKTFESKMNERSPSFLTLLQ